MRPNFEIVHFAGNYETEQQWGEMPDHENFCDKTPYYFAFVMLIIYWIIIPVVICVLCAAFSFAITAPTFIIDE